MNDSATHRVPSVDSSSSADVAPSPCAPSSRRSSVRAVAMAVLASAVTVASFAAAPTAVPRPVTAADPAPRRADAQWGAIAARPDGHGYAFNQPSRAAAEQVARAQCERPAGATGACDVRVWFERGCGALATGNFGEWGAAVGADKAAATKAAVAQCDAHLPTEPCRAAVSVCSGP